MPLHLSLQDQTTNFQLYTVPNGEVKVEALLSKESIWLTQKRMAELFTVGVPVISKHLKNIFKSNELEQDSVVSILETTADDGKNYQTQNYNLDAVISVGYQQITDIFAGFSLPRIIPLPWRGILKNGKQKNDRLQNYR